MIKMMKNYIVGLSIAIVIFAVVIALLYVWKVSLLGTSDKVGITMAISTVALVIVTGIYAWHTHKMAEEMREQRYDALRPIIDFRWRDSESISGGALMVGARGEVPSELSGQLLNVGVGPAIDLYSFNKVGQDSHHRYDFEVLKAGELARQVSLSVSQEGNIGILEAYYRDVYGRTFRSRIEIHPIEGQGLRTKLQVEKVQEDEK